MAKQDDKSIDAYRHKRDFARTPEPPPEDDTPEGGRRFVVHRHEARRLHYDLRLEMAGVLTCWAVPKGFSYDPVVKKLATHTEDHPLAYLEFDGVIPKGEYGGGTMTIWDHGVYELLATEDGPGAVEAGKVEIVLRGRKLRGEWHLVQTDAKEHRWILFKARDRYARAEEERPPFFDLDGARLAAVDRDAGPEFMEPGEESEPFSDPGWVYELDFAGRRARLTWDRGRAELVTKDGTDLTERLPRVVAEIEPIRSETAVLDGVLVATDDGQRPSRKRLDELLESGADGVVFYAFDLLHYEDWDIRALPLAERKSILKSLLPASERLLFVDHVSDRGEDFYRVTAAAALPAILAKRAASSYTAGPSSEWRRIPVIDRAKDEPGDVVGALEARAAARKIPFTNLDKVLWPDDGYTKGDLIRYYERVADVLVPYLRERPCHMLRYPDGIRGKAFYQKDAPAHIPDWVETESIPSGSRGESIRYIICNDRDTLVLMANLASIDLHPWFSQRRTMDVPDWAVFDLDPDGSPFPDVVRIARTLGRILRGIGLRPYLKTSGATGLHIYVPVVPRYTYDTTRDFCQGIAAFLVKEHPDIATIERKVSQRHGKVYIDYLQNRRGQTVVPPYVVRPRPRAPVSAPLDWDELELGLDPADFNITTMPARLERLGDLFAGTLTDPQDLLPAIEAFQKTYLSPK